MRIPAFPLAGPKSWAKCLLFLFLVVFTFTGWGQTTAFPGALGYGAYATGGRNGSVYHVTNLNDSGAGSFRTGVGSGNRVIVFDVGGHITLLSAISCQGNLTIAGQTAPGGICFDAGEVSFSSRANIICRYLRVRPGSNTASTGDDCLGMYQTTNAMIDHVSVGFGPYDNIDAVSANNLSFQNCIDSNPIGQQFGAHIENVAADCSWQYDIFANSHNRNPLAKINDTFINNVEYDNAAGYTTHTSTHFSHDLVNNYFVSGPSSGGSTDFPWFQVDNNQSVYETGNLFDSNENGALDGGTTTVYWYQGGSGGTVLSAPWSSWTSLIPTVSATLAWRYDISAAGAFPRDDVDSLLISQMQTLGNAPSGYTSGTAGAIYTSQTQTGLSNSGYGSITGGVAPVNFSGDGIADYWKLANNLNTNTAYPLTNTADGYTLLEHYLNYLGTPHAVTQSNVPVDVNLSQFTTGFSSTAVFSVSSPSNGTVTVLNSTNAHYVPTPGFTGLGGFNFTVTDGSFSLNAFVTACVTPATPPASAVNFNGALISVATNATVVVPPSNLTWQGDGTANVWNTTVSNWLNAGNSSAFKNSDVVTFDDIGSITPAINLNTTVSPGAIFFNDNNSYTLSGKGALTGSAAFSKTGSGTVTIGTTNSAYTGAISMSGGSLVFNLGTSLNASALTLSGGSTLSLPAGGIALNVSGNITVPAGASANITSGYVGDGGYGSFISGDTNSVLNFNGNQSFGGTSSSQFDSFSGTINIASGNLRFSATSSGNTYGSLKPNFIINGTLQPRNAGNTVVLGALNGTGQLQGPQTAGTGTGNSVFNIGGNNQSAIFYGTIISNANSAGSAICVDKLGTGTQTLMGNNTFTGTNAVIAGTLLLNGTNTPSLTTVFSGATLGGTGVISGPVSVKSGGILSPGNNGVGTLTFNGLLTNATPTLAYTLSSSPAAGNDLINVFGTLGMSGVQTFNFSLPNNALGAGTYSLIEGPTNSVQSGVSFASNLPGNTRQNISFSVAAPGSNPSYVRLFVNGSPASLLWAGTNSSSWDTSTIDWLNGTSADQFFNLDAVTFNDTTTNGSVLLAAALQPASILVNNNSLPYTFGGTGTITGSGPLTKNGAGTVTINTTNSAYSGNITLTGGTVTLGNGTSLGSGALTLSGGSTFSVGSSATFSGPIIVPAGQTGTFNSGALGNTFAGNLSSGDATSVLNFAGGESFSGINSAQFDGFTGTINIQSGATLRFFTGTGNTFSSFNPTFIINGTLQPRNAGNIIQLGAFSGSGTLSGPQSNSGSGDTLYVLGGNNASATFSGIISSNTAVPGSGVIVNKIGTGTLTLSGANTYAGGTTVSAGTLSVNNTSGSAVGTGDMEIFSGAALTGNGTIAASTTVDNGTTLAPGNPTGTLIISNNLALNDNSLLQFDLGTSSDSVQVSGDLALTGLLTVTNAGGFQAGSYTLFTCGGALALGNLQLVSAPAGYNYSFDTSTPGIVKLIVTVAAPPMIGGAALNLGDRMVLSGSGGPPGSPYYVAASTNLATPESAWVKILTNHFDASGNFSVTNDPATNGQNYYLIEVPNN